MQSITAGPIAPPAKTEALGRAALSGVHAYLRTHGADDQEFRVALSFHTVARDRFDIVLTPLMASVLKAELKRVLDCGQQGRDGR